MQSDVTDTDGDVTYVHTDTAMLIQPQLKRIENENKWKRRQRSYKLLDKNKVIYLHRWLSIFIQKESWSTNSRVIPRESRLHHDMYYSIYVK